VSKRKIVAIQPDSYGPRDASSPLWTKYLNEAGHETRAVDVRRADILEQVRGCHGFMWRHEHTPDSRQIARRLLPVLEREMGLAVYPDQRTCWHFDDKIAQAYLLEAAGIPVPKTWIWFDRDLASAWARDAAYPLVLKLWGGAGSTNVRLVRSFEEAKEWLARLFGPGLYGLDSASVNPWRRTGRVLKGAARTVTRGRPLYEAFLRRPFWELHRGYVLFQEFLPGNAWDTRVTVIGRRAFAYRRMNRPGDFRASGSGNFNTDPSQIDMETVKLAYRVAERLGTQSVAIDGLRRGEERVVGEISYAYVSWMVQSCPGHWERSGDGIAWVDGNMWPEEAHVSDFLTRLGARDADGAGIR
jgi:ribosomal protein S6-L-glutamate ligase RimK-like protein